MAAPREATEAEDPIPNEESIADDPHWITHIFGVWNFIIRPPRDRYSRVELLQSFQYDDFSICGQIGRRKHFSITNERGFALACTLFRPVLQNEQEKACVVYCHGNGSNRIGGFSLVSLLLPLGISVCCFDFAGSGMSEGEYVSLGFYERDDLSCVIDHLRSKVGYSRIGLWGYSMGATTVLLHAARDPTLAGLVADSPFSDLWQLLQEVCFHFMRLPALLSIPILQVVRHVIKGKAGFDVCDVSPLSCAGECFVPAFLAHGELDDFVVPRHTELLRKAYAGEASRYLIPDKGHANGRTEAFFARAAVFLVRALRWEDHIPAGSGEDAFKALLAGRIVGRAPREEAPPVEKEVVERIESLLNSGMTVKVCEALVQTAVVSCGPYRGAEFVPLVGATATGPAGAHACVSCPGRFHGTVTFLGDQAEMAFCWARTAAASVIGGHVEFAVLSSTVASITGVTLRRCFVPDGGPGVAGLHCRNVDAQDCTTIALRRGQPHEVVVTVTGRGAELSVAGQLVGSLPLPTAEVVAGCDIGDVHLWCVQWRHDGDGGGVKIRLDSTPDRNGATPVVNRLEAEVITPGERLAETLATLCLGATRPVGPTATLRRRLRSGVYELGPGVE